MTNPFHVAIIQKLSDTATKYGGIAQLGERLNGIQEVSGSIPLISTKTKSTSQDVLFCFGISGIEPLTYDCAKIFVLSLRVLFIELKM